MTKPLRIPWSKPTLIVGCISTQAGLSLLKLQRTETDLIEVRIDMLLQAKTPLTVITRVLRQRKHPVLLTLRTVDEGGVYSWKASERMDLFKKLIPLADAIDVELHNAEPLRGVLRLARTQGRGVILSAHSLRRKITLGRGQRWLEQFSHFRADIYKMATLCRNREDLKVLIRLVMDHPKKRLAVMGTGPMSGISRMVLPALGSRLVYGYLDEPTAPNQPSVQVLRDLLEIAGGTLPK